MTSDEKPPTAYALYRGHPNPGHPGTSIRFDLPKEAHVRLQVFDITGRSITTLLDGTLGPGRHVSVWNAQDAVGRRVVPGVYFYRLQAGGYSETRRLVVVR